MSGPAAELRAASAALLVESAPGLATLRVTGKDRLTWLNGLVTCDLAKLGPGRGAFGLVVQKTGKLLAEIFVVVGDGVVFVGLDPSRVETVVPYLEKHLVMEDAEMARTDDAWLVAHGPEGAAALALPAPGLARALVDRTGAGGCVAVGPASAVTAFAEAIRSGVPGALVATPEGLAQLYLERGLGRFGVDYDERNYAQEARLETLAVSFEKGCYLGQEAVFMLQARGHVKQRLTLLESAGDPPAAGAAIVDAAGAAVGQVTSAGRRSADGRVLVLGFVKYKLSQPGVELRVADRPAVVL